MSPAMRKNYIRDRAQAAITYIREYGNTMLWDLERMVPTHKLTQRLQVIFSRTDAVREVVDDDDTIRRRKCMHYLKPQWKFPASEDMKKEEAVTWIN